MQLKVQTSDNKVTNLPRLSCTVTVLREGMMVEDWGYWMATREDSSDKEVSLSTGGFDVWMTFSDSLTGNTTWTTSHLEK